MRVRKNLDNLVVDSAELIATGAITVAKTGQLASAKYWFEAVRLCGATEQTSPPPPSRFAGTQAVEANETADRTGDWWDEAAVVLTSDVKSVQAAATTLSVENEPEAEREDEPGRVSWGGKHEPSSREFGRLGRGDQETPTQRFLARRKAAEFAERIP